VTRTARRSTGLRDLRHIGLQNRDLRATERFYVDVLGLRVGFPHRGMLFFESRGAATS